MANGDERGKKHFCKETNSIIAEVSPASHAEAALPPQETQLGWITPTHLLIATIASAILGLGTTLFFGYTGFQCAVTAQGQTFWAFTAQDLTFAIGTALTGLGVTIQLLWARVLLFH